MKHRYRSPRLRTMLDVEQRTLTVAVQHEHYVRRDVSADISVLKLTSGPISQRCLDRLPAYCEDVYELLHSTDHLVSCRIVEDADGRCLRIVITYALPQALAASQLAILVASLPSAYRVPGLRDSMAWSVTDAGRGFRAGTASESSSHLTPYVGVRRRDYSRRKGSPSRAYDVIPGPRREEIDRVDAPMLGESPERYTADPDSRHFSHER